jgi:hypothetical protein
MEFDDGRKSALQRPKSTASSQLGRKYDRSANSPAEAAWFSLRAAHGRNDCVP